MTYCRRRQDLIDGRLAIPFTLEKQSFYSYNVEWMPCTQPDHLDDEQFNVVVTILGVSAYFSSVDLDFKDSL